MNAFNKKLLDQFEFFDIKNNINIEATRKLRPHGPGCAAEGPVVNGFMNVVDL